MEPCFSLAGQPNCRDPSLRESLFENTRKMAPEGQYLMLTLALHTHTHTHTLALTPAYMVTRTHMPLMRLSSLGHSYIHPA